MRRFVLLSFLLFGAAQTALAVCNGTLTVTRTERGTALLHYEDSYPGYSPTFGPPTVTDNSRYVDATYPSINWPVITIVQPVADVADSSKAAPGTVPAICHAEELDIGIPEDGYNEIRWYDQVTVNGANAGVRSSANMVGFRWVEGMVQCSTFPRVTSSSLAFEGAPINLAVSVLSGFPAVLKSTVSGQTITLDVVGVGWEGPIPVLPYDWCEPYSTTLSPLPAGEYTLLWRFPPPGGGQYRTVITSNLTVAKPARQRATRH